MTNLAEQPKPHLTPERKILLLMQNISLCATEAKKLGFPADSELYCCLHDAWSELDYWAHDFDDGA